VTRLPAADAYRRLLRDHVGPGLRGEGLRGSGSSWAQPSDTHWVMVGFQTDRWPAETAASFTSNLVVLSKAAWAAENVPAGRRPERPHPNESHYRGWGDGIHPTIGWAERIGFLMPVAQDHWWTVAPDTDLDGLATEVLVALRDHGLPAIRRVLAEERARRPGCSWNIGGRNWYRPCDAPADVALAGRGRRVFHCAEHAALPSIEHDGTVLGRWPDLL
jgi:hypothetical protein